MSPHEEHGTAQGMGDMERGTTQRVAARQRTWAQAWSALCVLLALWSVAWGVGWATGSTDAWAYGLVGLILLGCALWARRSAVRNAPPRHL
ncbi:hypothetical protein GTY65_39515 [Streptomyces sp. SID8379]|uniref:hypothetical protein n=1 Tax=unclassified Streptomyces TaxID=2593676 RepID=UPI00039CBBDC|nr:MULTISPECIES: hypothetical protein [unclassified Streptomyces]MYW70102.1 hypothetical protein [Streptomyces sp. SID8379]